MTAAAVYSWTVRFRDPAAAIATVQAAYEATTDDGWLVLKSTEGGVGRTVLAAPADAVLCAIRQPAAGSGELPEVAVRITHPEWDARQQADVAARIRAVLAAEL